MSFVYNDSEQVVIISTGTKYKWRVIYGKQLVKESDKEYVTKSKALSDGYVWQRQQAELIRRNR